MRRSVANPRSAHALASKVAREKIAQTLSDIGALWSRPSRRHEPTQPCSDRRHHETLAPGCSTSGRSLGGFRDRLTAVVIVLDGGPPRGAVHGRRPRRVAREVAY